jgi:S-adenosyl-L-methionine hydrolase (adenosine-forming)
MAPHLTLLTDFGTRDGYVAELLGVLYTGQPTADIITISHDIPPQDVEAAAFALRRYWRVWPPGTVHCVIVDPEVGTDRSALIVSAAGRVLLGPDNGVLSAALEVPDAQVFKLSVPSSASPVFHGRDVFAPAAVHLLQGVPPASLGTPYLGATIRRQSVAEAQADGSIVGRVAHCDHFGNAITNLPARSDGWVAIGSRRLAVVRTYAEVAPGMGCALTGSGGALEVAVRDGSAAAAYGLEVGMRVVWVPIDQE